MANKKFSEFTSQTDSANVQFVVGYNGSDNVRISPSNLLGAYLPLAGGTMTGNVIFNDNVSALFGTSSDLIIKHDGSHSKIENNTGHLFITNESDDKDIIFTTDDGAGGSIEYFKVDGSSVTNQFLKTVKLYDNVALWIGDDNDLQIYHDGSDSYVKDAGTGDLKLQGTNLRLKNGDGSSTFLEAISGAAVSIYHNGSKKFETTTTGVSVTGDIVTSGSVTIPDSKNLNIGSSGADLRINHDGTDSFIQNFVGNLEIQNGANDKDIIFKCDDGSGGVTSYLTLDGSTTHSYFSAGFVGIGTTAPSHPLHVRKDVSGDNVCRITNTTSTSGGNFGLLVDGGSTAADYGFQVKSYAGSSQFIVRGDGKATFAGTVDINGTGNTLHLNASSGVTYQKFSENSTGRFFLSTLNGSDGLAFIDADGSSERMRITSSGNILFGTTGTPDGTSVYGSGFIPVSNGKVALRMATSSTAAGTFIEFFNPNGSVGNITSTASATAFNTSSDYRLKEDLKDFDGLDKVSKIPVYDFKWKTDATRSYGVMAHELQEVLPDAVTGDKDAEKMQSVDYSKIVPLLIKSIQELKAEVESLKNK